MRLGLLLNAGIAAIALLVCWFVGARPDAVDLVVLALVLSVAAWTAFNAIVIFGLALQRSPAFRLMVRPGRLAFDTGRGNLTLLPADIEKYICYTNKIVLRHPGRIGPSFRPFLRGQPDETTLYTVMMSGGQAEIRRQLATFDPGFAGKQARTPGSILSWISP
jgi:hypothetical protein